MTRPLRIVTHKNWLAESFPGAVQDFGFDIDPATAAETLWWAPGAWVASARKAGVTMPLLSCGPYWLDNVNIDFTGREVSTMWLCDVAPFFEREMQLCRKHPEVFVKLPEAKLDSFPARLHGTQRMRDNLAQYHLPDNTLVQIQEAVKFRTEGRFFIAHGAVVASSTYRHDDWVWGSENPPIGPLVCNKMLKMERFVNEFLSSGHKCPPGFVLDVGILEGGSPKIVEANAAWSSGPYDCDPAGVVQAIAAAHDFEGQYPQWAWQHNPVFDKVGPLKVVARG